MIRKIALGLGILGVLGPGPLAAQPPKPMPPTPEMEKAAELFRAGKIKDALDTLEQAAKVNPLLSPPRVTLAGWFAQANRGSDARTALEQAAAADPRHPEVLLLNASFAFGEGRITDAILSCQMAVLTAEDKRWTPDQRQRFLRDGRLGLASAFETRGDFTSAKEALFGLLNTEPKNGVLRQRLASAIFQTGKPEEALAELQKAFADDATLDPPEMRMAALWNGKGDREKAEDWLKKSVSTHSQNPKSHRAYAAFLLDEGKPDAAALYIEAANKLDAMARDQIALRALLHRHKKEFALAEPLFEQLYKDGPSDAFAIANLAIVLGESADEKKKKRAVDLAESLVKQNSRSVDAFAVYGWCLFKVNRIDDAEKALSTATSMGAVSLDTAYYLARLLNERQKFADAQTLLKNAIGNRGPFVYRAEAQALLAELDQKVPPKKEEPKKP